MSGAEPRSPREVREGVRAGILDAIAQDVERRSGRTAGRLALAGLAGVAGAIGAMLLVSTHPFDHHPYWHELVFSAVWTGVLVISFCFVLLEVRTPALPLDRAGAVGLAALGIAGVCSLCCPDPHVMNWWFGSSPGSAIAMRLSAWGSALCFGFASALLFALVPAVLLIPRSAPAQPARLAASGFVALLLAPAVILDSVGFPPTLFAAWLTGTLLGSYAGVTCALPLRSLLPLG
jgi:hypothetical protein